MKVQELIDVLNQLSPEEKSYNLQIYSPEAMKLWKIKPIDLDCDYDDGLDVDYDEKYVELVIEDYDK